MGGSDLYSCRSDMAIAREAGRTKIRGTGWEDGNVRLQSTDLILEDIRHSANRRVRFFLSEKRKAICESHSMDRGLLRTTFLITHLYGNAIENELCTYLTV